MVWTTAGGGELGQERGEVLLEDGALGSGAYDVALCVLCVCVYI